MSEAVSWRRRHHKRNGLKSSDGKSRLIFQLRETCPMATEPKRTEDSDNVVSLREARARARQAETKARAEASKTASGRAAPEKKIPALLIFLVLLAILVAYKFLGN